MLGSNPHRETGYRGEASIVLHSFSRQIPGYLRDLAAMRRLRILSSLFCTWRRSVVI
jgi:hypothetical protein